MLISDWSSDVCSSDLCQYCAGWLQKSLACSPVRFDLSKLDVFGVDREPNQAFGCAEIGQDHASPACLSSPCSWAANSGSALRAASFQIGRAPGRVRVWQ